MSNDDFVKRIARIDVRASALNLRRRLQMQTVPNFPIIPIVEHEMTRIIDGYQLHVEEKLEGKEAYVAGFPHPHMVTTNRAYSRAAENDRHYRFTFAHEIGHLVLHLHYLRAADALAARLIADTREVAQKSLLETQANWFAAEFLMPDYIVRGCDNPQDLAVTCGVSESAATIRMLELQLWPPKNENVVRGFEELSKYLKGQGPRPKVPSRSDIGNIDDTAGRQSARKNEWDDYNKKVSGRLCGVAVNEAFAARYVRPRVGGRGI